MRERFGSAVHLVIAAQALLLPAAAAGQVDWAAIDPAFEGATFVRDDVACAVCHEESVHPFQQTRHDRGFRLGGRAGDCESCHGPRSKHVEEPGEERGFSELAPRQQSAVCLQCHEGGARMAWKTSVRTTTG